MLIKSLPLREIIEVPEFPAEIIRITSRNEKEFITYNMYVNINVDDAVDLSATNMSVNVYKTKPADPPVPKSIKSASLFSTSTKALETNILKSRIAEKDLAIATHQIDLTKYFSNNLANVAKGVKAGGYTKPRFQSRQQINSISARTIKVKQTNPFTQASQASYTPVTPGIVSPPGLTLKKNTNIPLNSSVIQGISMPAPPSVSFSKSLVAVKKDPASVTASSNLGFNKPFSSSLMTAKVASFVFTAPRSLPPLGVVKLSPEIKEVKFQISIEKEKIEGAASFYVNFDIENANGVSVASAETNISHARIYNSFITPSIAPSLEAEYIKPGVVSITVGINKERFDMKPFSLSRTLIGNNASDYCKRIKVFRRVTAPQAAGTDVGTPWSEVLDVGINDDMSHVTVRDEVLTSRPLVYRAICYGENFKPSEKFSSTVVLPLKMFEAAQTGAMTAISSLDSPGSNSYVNIKVKDIPEDVVAVMVKRFNKTTSSDSDRMASKGRGFIYVGRTARDQQKLVVTSDKNAELIFEDRTAKSGNNYLYVPVGFTKRGKKITGSMSVMEISTSPQRSQVSIGAKNPVIALRDGDSSSIVIELKGKFTEFGFSEIRKALGSAQQANLFSKDILEDRDKFESLINFLVERKNTKTGELESFGTYNTGEFVDNASVRSEKNIKGIDPGVEYVYTITALLSSPETLFPTLKRPDVDIKSLLPFARKVSKFRNPLSINKSTLQSTLRQVDKSVPSSIEPSDPLVAGRTNVQITKTFRFPVSKVGDSTVKIEEYMKFNRISWQYPSPQEIDHFRIYILSSGGRVLLDTVHCDPTTSEFYYRHYSKDYAVGFKYMIQPVDLSYNEMRPILTKSQTSKLANTLIGSPTQTSISQLSNAFNNMVSIT